MTTIIQDLRYGLRMLGKNPGFTAMAIVTLALGLGASATIFSGINGLFLRPLPVKDPGRLVGLAFGQRGASGEFNFSYLDFQDLRDQETRFDGMFAYRVGFDGLSDGKTVDRVAAAYVTGNYFSVLGLKPTLGRLILPSEDNVSGQDPVLVLGYSYWKSRFGGDPGVIGKQLSIDGRAVTVVGVAPESFHGLLSIVDTQAYLPLNMSRIWGSGTWFRWRDNHTLFVVARLKRGTSVARAQASLDVIGLRLAKRYPTTDAAAAMRVFPEAEARLSPQPQPGHYREEMIAVASFLALAALLLLLACFNVANLLLVRTTARGHEMAVRAALGARRGRLSRQALTESLLLAFLGGAAGVVAGIWSSSLLGSINLNIGLPYHLDFSFDWRVYGFAIAASIASGLVMGAAPALRAARSRPEDALHGEGRTVAGGRYRLRDALVAAQVAVSIILLVAAGLFARSLREVQRIDLGFNPRHVLNLSMNLHEGGYNEEQGREFYENLLTRAQAMPGVRSASLAALVPLGPDENDDAIHIEGRLPVPGRAATRLFDNQVSPGYFKTLRISLLRGREFTKSDNAFAPLVAVINQAMARRFWPGEDPIGKRFKVDSESNPWTQVIGVVQDGKYRGVSDEARPYFYMPLAQNYSAEQTLQVRTAQDPTAIAGALERLIHGLAPDLPVFRVQTMEQAVNTPWGLLDFRLAAGLAAALGLVGSLLAVVGVYGVISYAASRRAHEIGVRMALGAQPADVIKMIFGQGLTIVGVGVAAGVLVSLAAGGVIANFLYGVSPRDPFTYAAGVALIAAAALAACYLPARRATRIDPIGALRCE